MSNAALQLGLFIAKFFHAAVETLQYLQKGDIMNKSLKSCLHSLKSMVELLLLVFFSYSGGMGNPGASSRVSRSSLIKAKLEDL